MLISLKHRFAFLCMPKTGTTAIEQALRRHVQIVCGGANALKHADYATFEAHFWPFLQTLEHSFDLGGFVVVAAMREPIEWRHSWYRYRTREKLRTGDAQLRGKFTGGVSFSEFLDEHFSRHPRPFARLRSQARFLAGADGARGARLRLFRYEDFGTLTAFLAERIGAPLKVPHRNVSPIPAEHAEIAAARARFADRLADEYRLYDAIGAGVGSLVSPSSAGL